MVSVQPRHFGIVVADLERSLAFYGGLLGFAVARRMEEEGPFIDAVLGLPATRVTTVKLEAEPGGVQIELLHFHSHPDPAPRPPQPWSVGPTHMAFTVTGLPDLYRRLSAAGTTFTTPPRLSVDGRALVTFCRDPDGTLLELVELQPQGT